MTYSVYVQISLAVIMLIVQGRVHGQVEYSRHELPPLYTFDDYDLCFLNGTSKLSSTYCMVYAEIKPENSSELWQKVTTHSEATIFHYHHDRLFFGMCMERCIRYADGSSLTDDDIVNNEITEYLEQVHKRPLDVEMRTKYASMIHNCLNDEFERKYNLKVRTFVEYCEGREEDTVVEKDAAESVLYKIFEIIGLLIVLSSIYDYCLKSNQAEESQTNEFYKNNLEQPMSRLLTSFSINRNYYRLIQPYRAVIGNDFRYLDGFRSVCTLIVLHAHTFYLQFQHIRNPEYFEKFGHTTDGLLILNTSTVIEIFTVMSGLLLYVKFTEGRYVTPQTTWRKCIKTYLFIVLSRLMRFLPSVALMVLVNATVFTRFTDGPFWRHISEPSRIFSRENGWKNILMVNNFSLKDTVSSHTWYIAADFQLAAFYTLVLIFIAKYPQYKKRVLTSLAALAVVIPTLVSYFLKLAPAFVINPECYRYAFFKDMSVFYNLYTVSYTNLGGYLFGIWCGDIYLKYLRNEEVCQRFRRVLKYELGAWLALPIAGCISFVGTIMIVREPSIWTALYSGLNRNLWIIFVCGLPLLGMACKGGMIAYEFCCLPIFRVLARLSFQMYLWHLMILHVTNGHLRTPYHMSTLYFNGQAMITIFLSTVVAFFACLLVEYPIAQFFDSLQTRRIRTDKDHPKETKVQ